MNKKGGLDERLKLFMGKDMREYLAERFPESEVEDEYVLYQFVVFIKKIERENNEGTFVLHVNHLWMKRKMDC